MTFLTKGMCLEQNSDWDKMTPSGANSLSGFFRRVHRKHVSKDGLVVPLNSHQFELEGAGIVRNTQRKRGATEADGSQEEPRELPLNPKITT